MQKNTYLYNNVGTRTIKTENVEQAMTIDIIIELLIVLFVSFCIVVSYE